MNASKRPLILIVDDKSTNLKALRALLTGIEAEIVEAHSGNEALGLMLEHEFALVLLDVDMPGMDGFEVARTAFKLERTRNLPILFVTAAYKDELHRLQGYRIGAVDYIEKPINDVVLQAKVALFLKLYNARTESERLRQALQITEERFKFALEGSDDGMWDWDIPSGAVYFSPRLAGMLGYTPGDLEPHVQAWERLLHPDDRAAVMSVLDLHLAGRTPFYQTEHRLLTRNGDWLWILDRGKVVTRDRSGVPLRMVGTHQDISQRKQLEEEIRQGKERYEELTTRIPIGVYKFRLSKEGAMSFDYVSEPFCIFLGLNREALMKDVSLAFRSTHPEEQEELIRLNQEVTRKKEPFLWIGRFLVSGKTRWLQIQSTPYDEPNGDTTWGGVAIDITERKLLEIALREAKQEAERATRAKSRFLATMSHEIRTPMNTILGMGEILRESPRLSPRERQLVQIANRAGDTLMALINDILDLSKIEAGQLRLEQIPFSPEDEITQTLAITRTQASAKGIEIVQHVDPNLPRHVLGDPQRLRQILLNLLGNAVKFTHQGRITLRAAAEDGETIHFSVQDTGIGIPEERQEAIFQPFMQAEDSTTRRFGGTGLGLSICQQLVAHMGGRIWLESQPGAGSRFHFTVHLPGTAPRQEEHSGKRPSPEAVLRETAPLPSILLVDDTADNRLVVGAFLEGGPYRLIEASNGIDALKQFESSRFTLILMDVMMPEMDGLETTRRIRAMERARGLQRTPVIALTANAMKEDMELTLAAGCDQHLSKPLRRIDLMDALTRHVGPSCTPPPAMIPPSPALPLPHLIIDPETLSQLKEETGRGFGRILEMFLRNLPGRLDALQNAWEIHDSETMRQVAHKLKGTSCTFGAARFAALCAELEQLTLRDAALITLRESLEKVREAGQDVQKQLETLLNTLQSP